MYIVQTEEEKKTEKVKLLKKGFVGVDLSYMSILYWRRNL